MPAPKPAFRLSLVEARQVFVAAQGFPVQPGRSVASALEETGFVRTLGGVDVYLEVRARVPGLKRVDLEAAVAAGEAQVTPAVRGCIYHGRSFSLDTDDELRTRSQQVRQVGTAVGAG